MSDVLRCPVCSCAFSFLPPHTRSRVQRASGIPCALDIEGERFQARLGRSASRECDFAFAVIACNKREAFVQGSEATKQSIFLYVAEWIASRSLSSGAHSRDPAARNDDLVSTPPPKQKRRPNIPAPLIQTHDETTSTIYPVP